MPRLTGQSLEVAPQVACLWPYSSARGIETVAWTEYQSACEHILGGKGGWWDIIVILRRVFRALWIQKSSQPGNKSGKTTTVLVRQLF